MKTRYKIIIVCLISTVVGIFAVALSQIDIYDYNKHYTVFGPGSPLAESGSGNPVLDENNCKRYADWLTKHQKNNINRYDENERYPPWGNQIFPLVDYCTTNGDFVKFGTDDKIKWVFYRIAKPVTPSDQECAKLFDKIFDTWKEHVDKNYGGPGQPILEPPTVAGLIAGSEGGQEFRESNCRYTVNDWAYLVEHQDEVWGHVDWPKIEPFSSNQERKPLSDIEINEKCAEWFDKIMLGAEHSSSDFDLKYELTETNEFRDLKCASIITKWKDLSEYDVLDIGISWEEIASNELKEPTNVENEN